MQNMDEREDNFVSSPLVRQFSDKLNQSGRTDVLPVALSVAIEHREQDRQSKQAEIDDWGKWIAGLSKSRTSQEIQLEQYKEEVTQAWSKIRELDPVRLDATNSKDGVPRIEDLYEAVQVAQNSWSQKKSGSFQTLKSRFIGFAKTLEDYSDLFNFIPSGDKYVCLVSGVVSTIIKASARYDRAANAFSEGLGGISSSMAFVNNELKLSNTPEMQILVVKLYVEVFKFLSTAIQWFLQRKTRFGHSINGKHVEEIKKMTDNITNIVVQIGEQGKQFSRGVIHEIKSDVGELRNELMNARNEVKMLHTNNQQQQEQLNYMTHGIGLLLQLRMSHGKSSMNATQKRDILELHLGDLMGRSLQDIEQNISEGFDVSPGTLLVTDIEAAEDTDDDSVAATTTEIYTKYDLEHFTSHLQSYVDDGRQALSVASRGQPRSGIPQESLSGLRRWINAQDTKFVWIQGPSQPGQNALSRMAMQICDITLGAGISCVSFYSRLRPPSQEHPALTPPQAALVACLYSIMLQLIQLLPVELTATNIDFSSTRFAGLNGTFISARLALDIIHDLMSEITDMLYWIIDGVNLMEEPDTRPLITELIDLLRQQGRSRVCKVCFTTSGNSLVLSQSLDTEEKVNATRRFAPGRAFVGGFDVKNLKNVVRDGSPSGK